MYLYILVLPIAPPHFSLKGIPLTSDTVLGLIILIYLGMLFLSREVRERFSSGVRDYIHDYLSLFLTGLLAIMLLSVSYATDRTIALSESLRFMTYLALFFIIKYELNHTKALRGMLRAYLAISLFLGIFGLIQYYTGINLDQRFYMEWSFGARARIAATLENPNAYAAYLILILFPVIMLTLHHLNRLIGLFYAALSILLITNMALTFSRNALIAFAIGCGVLILIYSWKLLFVFAPLGIASLFIPEVARRIGDIADATENISRIKLWKTALKMIQDHPLLGIGNGNFVTRYDDYIARYPELRFEDWTHYPSHNSYLKVQSELGVIGTVTFLGTLASALLKIKELLFVTQDRWFKAFYTGFFASMIAFYFMNSLDNLFFVPKATSYFWLTLAIGDALLYTYRNGSRNDFTPRSPYSYINYDESGHFEYDRVRILPLIKK